MQFKHVVQDLIENGKLEIDGLKTNFDHTTFKEPFPKYEKGEASQPKNGKAAINYTFVNAKNVINRLEVLEESVNMMEDKDPNGHDSNMSSPIHGDKPILVLRGAHSKESSQGPLVIRGPNSNLCKFPPKISMLLHKLKVPLSSKDLVQANQVIQNNCNPRMFLQN